MWIRLLNGQIPLYLISLIGCNCWSGFHALTFEWILWFWSNLAYMLIFVIHQMSWFIDVKEWLHRFDGGNHYWLYWLVMKLIWHLTLNQVTWGPIFMHLLQGSWFLVLLQTTHSFCRSSILYYFKPVIKLLCNKCIVALHYISINHDTVICLLIPHKIFLCLCVKSVAVSSGLLWPLPRVWSCLPGAADWARSFGHRAQSTQGAQDLWAEANVRAR